MTILGIDPILGFDPFGLGIGVWLIILMLYTVYTERHNNE